LYRETIDHGEITTLPSRISSPRRMISAIREAFEMASSSSSSTPLNAFGDLDLAFTHQQLQCHFTRMYMRAGSVVRRNSLSTVG
jgi:hypothetical protein